MSEAVALPALNDASLLRTDALLGGEWVAGSTRFGVFNPATGELLTEVSSSTADTARLAAEVAERALPAWRARTARERGLLLVRWAQQLRQHADDLATLMTAEQGKPRAEARGEVSYAASFLEWYAEEGKRVHGETIPSSEPNKRNWVWKQPVGVCAAITPWNFPLAMITRKVAPALAAGCPVIIKPAEQTPLTALACCRVGHPRGHARLACSTCITGQTPTIRSPLDRFCVPAMWCATSASLALPKWAAS